MRKLTEANPRWAYPRAMRAAFLFVAAWVCLCASVLASDDAIWILGPAPQKVVNIIDGYGAFFDGKQWLILNSEGEVSGRCPEEVKAVWHFSEGLAPCKVGDKYGFISVFGAVVIKPTFEGVSRFQYGLAAASVTSNGKTLWGYIDPGGEFVIKPQYELTRQFGLDGIAQVKHKGKWGYIDALGHWLIKPAFDRAESFADGRALVVVDGEYFYIDATGAGVISVADTMEAFSFSEGLAAVCVINPPDAAVDPGQARFGFIDVQGEWVIASTLDWAATSFAGGVAVVFDHATTGLIDRHGRFRAMDGIDYVVREGLVTAKDERTGKWGYRDMAGKFVIEPVYDEARSFSGGRAFARQGDNWSLIDHRGSPHWESAWRSDFVSVSDFHARPFQRRTTLRVEPVDFDNPFLAELYSYAIKHFPEGSWLSFGPDSSYRQIVFFSRGRKIELASWHPPYETNPNLVASSSGITSLDGQSREEFLSKDDPAYVAKRNAFDEIERRLREHYAE